MPASVGVAAFEHLKLKGVFEEVPSPARLLALLTEPLLIGGRQVHYRFARQRAHYLSKAFELLAAEKPTFSSGKSLREWLVKIPGIGLKTGSWVARNWLDADDVAILDIHILRAGVLAGFFSKDLTVERHYLALEAHFLAFSGAIGVRPSELDGVIWTEMRNSQRTVSKLIRNLTQDDKVARRLQLRAYVGRPDSQQSRLID